MNRQTIRIVAGANLVAGCLLLQGCGMFSKKSDQTPTTVPGGSQPPVATVPVEPTATMPPVETAPVELAPVHSTTPYAIQKGDMITTVAYKFGLRWQDVMAVNPGLDAKKLRVGQVIQLPGQVDVVKARHVPTATPKAGAPKTSAPKTAGHAEAAVSGPATTYVVKSGDSLSTIAHKHGVKTAALREANGMKNDRISVGQKLKVPGAKKTPDAATVGKKTDTAVAPKTAAPKVGGVAPKSLTETKPAVTNHPVVTPPPAVKPVPAVESAPVKVEPPAGTPVADSSTQTYTVKEGEDLYAVAIRWGVSPSDLKALNNLTSTELKAGTVLKIPGAAQ